MNHWKGTITNQLLQFFSCGSGKIATGIKDVLMKIVKEKGDVDDADAAARFDKIAKGRYAADIFD